jgi:hypothetical protein
MGMTAQLELLLEPEPDDWRLDAHTREVGRRGIAEARRMLAQATDTRPGEPTGGPSRRTAA